MVLNKLTLEPVGQVNEILPPVLISCDSSTYLSDNISGKYRFGHTIHHYVVRLMTSSASFMNIVLESSTWYEGAP